MCLNESFDIKSFISSIKEPIIHPGMYERVQEMIHIIDRIANTCNMSLYLIDYKKKDLLTFLRTHYF